MQQGGGLIEFARSHNNTQVQKNNYTQVQKIKADLMRDVSPPRSNVQPLGLSANDLSYGKVWVGQCAYTLVLIQYMILSSHDHILTSQIMTKNDNWKISHVKMSHIVNKINWIFEP